MTDETPPNLLRWRDDEGVAVTLRVPLVGVRGAEEGLAGCAVATAEGARLAAGRVAFDDFHDPRCFEAIVAAAALPPDMTDEEDRIAAVAARAELEPALVRSWVASRPVLVDQAGALATAVREAGRRRREVRQLVDALRALGAQVVTP